MRISDWSSDVCSSDLRHGCPAVLGSVLHHCSAAGGRVGWEAHNPYRNRRRIGEGLCEYSVGLWSSVRHYRHGFRLRSEEHTSELQSLMRISYAVFCLKKNKHNKLSQRHSSNHKTDKH